MTPYKLNSSIAQWLRSTNNFWLSLYVVAVVFSLYTCIYALRKTYTVAIFDQQVFLGVSYKVWLVTSQVIGYALSKFYGIKIIAELQATSRATGILLMSALAAISW